MSLVDPNARRGARTIIQGVLAIALLCLVWEAASRITQQAYLLEVIRWSLSIIGLGTLGYIMENSLRAIRLSLGRDGAKVEMDGDND